jgi:hypothetical protein
MCFVVQKTSLELERAMLTTLYAASTKNTKSWHVRKGDLQCAFPRDVPMVTSMKLSFIAYNNNSTSTGFTLGETIHFGSLEFTTDRLGHLNLSPKQWDSRAIFIGMVHSGSPTLHTAFKDSSDEGSAATRCNVVTPTIPITTTLVPENTPAL